MSECRCMTPPFYFLDYDSQSLGVDETNGRFGEVTCHNLCVVIQSVHELGIEAAFSTEAVA